LDILEHRGYQVDAYRKFSPAEATAAVAVATAKNFPSLNFKVFKKEDKTHVCDVRYTTFTRQMADEFFNDIEDANSELTEVVVMMPIPTAVLHHTVALKQYMKMKQMVPPILVKIYSYQLIRSIAYIHAVGICHRDIKPQNVLVDTNSHILKLCDFGSAKKLVPGEPNVSYICSRYYRAPELIFGNSNYTTQIDVWSVGCVIAELMLGQPIFPGESGVDQLVEIIKVLGTPTREQILSMNPDYKEYKFPQIKPMAWEKVFRSKTPKEAVDYVSKLLVYDPSIRPTPLESLADSYFDELRDQKTRLPNGSPLPDLFNYTPEERRVNPKLVEQLIPPWYAAMKTPM
jgi:glycogen synthase kinase 3 beta